MRTAKMFWRDMCLGTFRHGARFLIIPLVVVLMTAGFAEYAANIYEAGTIAGSGTAADYYLCVMQGMYIYKFSPDSTFVIPISWFMLHIGLAYLTAYYPCKDYNEYGAIVLPAGGSRIRWWIAKMFWCLMTVFLYCHNLRDQCLCAWCKAKCGFFSGSVGTFVWRFYELCQPVRYDSDFRFAAICHICADDRSTDAFQFFVYTRYKLCCNVWGLYSVCLLYLLVATGKLYDVAEKFLYQL